MKAPDKIYVHRTIHLGLLSAAEIDVTGRDEQYIRKDALLEWAKIRQECQNLHLEYDAGVYDCLQCLIDKLNSM